MKKDVEASENSHLVQVKTLPAFRGPEKTSLKAQLSRVCFLATVQWTVAPWPLIGHEL